MDIMTARGWKRMQVLCTNEVWELVSWDALAKKYVPNVNGTLRCVRVDQGYGGLIPEAPPMYRGKLPSDEFLKAIKDIEDRIS